MKSEDRILKFFGEFGNCVLNGDCTNNNALVVGSILTESVFPE